MLVISSFCLVCLLESMILSLVTTREITRETTREIFVLVFSWFTIMSTVVFNLRTNVTVVFNLRKNKLIAKIFLELLIPTVKAE